MTKHFSELIKQKEKCEHNKTVVFIKVIYMLLTFQTFKHTTQPFITMSCGLGALLLLVLYIIWDVNYFIRVVFTVGLGRLFQKKRKVVDTTSIYGKNVFSSWQNSNKPTRFWVDANDHHISKCYDD